MLPSLARTYLATALEGTPQVLAGLLGHLDESDSCWDFRPDPERFTLREIVSHLASIEPAWLSRSVRILDEETPFFPRVAIQNDAIALNTPGANLALLRDSRTQYVGFLRGLDESQWQRPARSEMLGALTMETQATFVLAHDGYHIGQVAQWLEQAAAT